MNNTGLKYDEGKPRMDLLDPTLTRGIAAVLTFGAEKYAADNWRGGIHFTRLIASIHRHLASIQEGEDIDPESGLPHIYHIGCNVQFLGWMMQNRPDLDDRWKEFEPHKDELNMTAIEHMAEQSPAMVEENYIPPPEKWQIGFFVDADQRN